MKNYLQPYSGILSTVRIGFLFSFFCFLFFAVCARKRIDRNHPRMEGLWTRMFPSYQYIREQINRGKLGEIQLVDASFGDAELRDVERLTWVSLQISHLFRSLTIPC